MAADRHDPQADARAAGAGYWSLTMQHFDQDPFLSVVARAQAAQALGSVANRLERKARDTFGFINFLIGTGFGVCLTLAALSFMGGA